MHDESAIAALVASARRGDAVAFGRLVQMFLSAVIATALAVVRRRESAEDVAQIAFLRAWRGMSSLQSDAAFASWLLTITRNCARNWLRDHAGDIKLLDESAAAGVAAPLARDDELPAAVQKLPDELREVVLLRYVSDLSYEEIAAAIGEPLSLVRDRLYRAKQALQEFLK